MAAALACNGGDATGTRAAASYDIIIADSHARAAAIFASHCQQLASQVIVPVGDNCTTFDARGGIQLSSYGAAIATLYLHRNKTQSAAASEFFRQLALCLGPGVSGPVQQPLEMAFVARAFALFNRRSPWLQEKHFATLSSAAEAAMQAMFFRYLVQFGPIEQRFPTIWSQYGSENRDVVEQTSCFIAAQYLSLDPMYASRMLPGNRTVADVAVLWDNFLYEWLKARATSGFFIELGSGSYWYRTWPAVLNLLDLPLSSRVRTRAKMFVDLAMVEAEQAR